MEIVLSTRNPSKIKQIRAIFDGTPISILSLGDAKIEGEGIEDGETLALNALKKAAFAHDEIGGWVMADDTGLFIDALDGEPGIKAARWAGDTATTDEITAYTLKKLEGVSERGARFETVVAIISPSGESFFFKGTVRGNLLEAPRVRPQPKMPYSPLFVPEGSDLVWAEMDTEAENAVSHRGKAFRKARVFLEEMLGAV